MLGNSVYLLFKPITDLPTHRMGGMWLGERRTAANWDQEFAKSITMHHHRQVAFVFPVSMSSHTKQPTILSTSGQLLALFNLRNSKCLRGEWLIQRGLGVCKAPWAGTGEVCKPGERAGSEKRPWREAAR